MQLQAPIPKTVTSIKDVPADVFINKYAQHLKESGQFDVPKWMEYAKSSCARELSPYDADFLYIRAASLIRHLCFRADAGVGRFRTVYGHRQNNGVNPHHHRRAGGKIIRHCLQQLQKMDLLAAEAGAIRKLSPKGQSSVDQIARQCM